MIVSRNRRTNPSLVNDQRIHHCLFRMIQRSPRPGMKQKPARILASQTTIATYLAAFL
jgi:hypothetical protein